MPDSFTLADLEAMSKPADSVTPVDTPTPETPVIPDVTPIQDTAETPSVPVAEVTDVVVEPAEPTPAEPAAVTVEPEAADEPAEPKGSRARERITGLIDENKSLRDYAEMWRLEALKAVKPTEQPAAPPAVVPKTDDAPTLDSFDGDVAKWTQAHTAWTQKQIQTGIQSALQGAKQQQTAEETRVAFVTREQAFVAKHPDYPVVVGSKSLPQLAPEVASHLVSNEMGVEVMYYLGLNPDVATRIARQSVGQQLVSIGRLEGEIAQKAAAPKPAPKVPQKTNNVTQAPPPPTPVPASGSIAVDPMSMSIEEFVIWDRQQKIDKKKMLAPNARPRR